MFVVQDYKYQRIAEPLDELLLPNDVVALASSLSAEQKSEIHPIHHMPFRTDAYTVSIFLGLFIIAFFPDVFNLVLRLPIFLFQFLLFTSQYLTKHHSPTTTTTSSLPNVPPYPSAVCDPSLNLRILDLERKTATMSWSQKQFTLPSKSRGAYLVTDEVMKQVPEIKDYKVGLLNLFVQHTSCALSLNENWDEEVRYV